MWRDHAKGVAWQNDQRRRRGTWRNVAAGSVFRESSLQTAERYAERGDAVALALIEAYKAALVTASFLK